MIGEFELVYKGQRLRLPDIPDVRRLVSLMARESLPGKVPICPDPNHTGECGPQGHSLLPAQRELTEGIEANLILTFRDEDGKEWLAAAYVGPLIRNAEEGQEVTMEVDALKDRAFTLHGIKVICR